jgi:hypothetical protein
MTPRRKAPARRVFSGLAGSPLAVVAEVRRGPQPKYGTAMTARQRQRESRARRQEPEKRNLIARILKIQRQGIGVPRKGLVTGEDIKESNRIRLRQLRDELMALTLRDLQRYLDGLKSSGDRIGRLHGETSGNSDPINGVSHVERVIAAVERDEHGHKAKIGHGPAVFDKPEAMDDPADVYQARFNPNKAEPEQRLDDAIEHLLKKFSGKCQWCDEQFASKGAYENHLYELFRRFTSRKDATTDLVEGIEEMYVPPEIRRAWEADIDRAKSEIRTEPHFTGISAMIAAARKHDREIKQKARAAGFRARPVWKTKVIS